MQPLLPAHRIPVPDPRFVLQNYEPAYLKLHRNGGFEQRVEEALRELEDCCACPRDCHINRLRDEKKVCHTGRYAVVSSAFAHFGEEDCLRGWRGSGTIFFGLCNLRCVFCQNWDISQQHNGREYNPDQLADVMLELQAQGCHNINFVTPEHVAPQMIEAIAVAATRGLHLPIVYNTSAYDAIASLKLLEGIVDIYMPDFKFWEKESARQFTKAKDYPEVARRAVLEMHRQVGVLRFGRDGLARRGVLLRHLVMPGGVDEAGQIFDWLAEHVSKDTYVNVMDQYRPQYQVGQNVKYANIERRPDRQEFVRTVAVAKDAGLWRFDTRH